MNHLVVNKVKNVFQTSRSATVQLIVLTKVMKVC